MKVQGKATRTIWVATDQKSVEIIDQTQLPHFFTTRILHSAADARDAISRMLVRGAPLIGATAAYGIWLAMTADASDAALDSVCKQLMATRPTAVNLRWAIESMRMVLAALPPTSRAAAARKRADAIADEDVAINRTIGEHGLTLIRDLAVSKRGPVNILTHCNAGWLATVDWGTAIAPIYAAHDAGLPVHVWVDETRPRNQGASLTAWELNQHGVPHTVIVDNAGGHLMQRGLVDMAIVGTDRTTADGDVANKIGTYLKAVAAKDCGVPFYVALPGPTIDWSLSDGLRDIPIEERSGVEVSHIAGLTDERKIASVRLIPEGSKTFNPGFDVTPARLVTALITERGIAEASREGLFRLYPEFAHRAASTG